MSKKKYPSKDLMQDLTQDLEIIDLETVDLEEIDTKENHREDRNTEREDFEGEDFEWEDSEREDSQWEDTQGEDSEAPGRDSLFFRINWHIVLAAGFLIFIASLVLWFFNYGNYVNTDELDSIVGNDDIETRDSILPLVGDDIVLPEDDGITTIVAFGNAPFADDRDSPDNLANLIADLSGATVYNCSVKDSYLAAHEVSFYADKYPMDAFNFYWLTTLVTLDNQVIYEQAFDAMGDEIPQDALEAYQTLSDLDFNQVDVITIMYDASDYFAGNEMYNDDNRTDIKQFAGNLEAGIELLQEYFPHIRIIVMSPTYAYGLDENGNYISSDIKRYGQDVLSTYVTAQFQSAYYRSVTYIDHHLGTFTEDNATEYLTDHIHLNLKGRKAVAERFVYALTYYSK